MRINELNSLVKGRRMPEDLINSNWNMNPKYDGEEWCDYHSLTIIRTTGECHAYVIEIPSDYREDENVSLNIHFITDLESVVLELRIFAWEYMCNMFSDKTNLKLKERRQLEDIIMELFDLKKPIKQSVITQ